MPKIDVAQQTTPAATINLVLFGTAGCHLCAQAGAILADFKQHPLAVETSDIAEQQQWQEKYAARIPVLYHPETEQELAWPFASEQVQTFINALNND